MDRDRDRRRRRSPERPKDRIRVRGRDTSPLERSQDIIGKVRGRETSPVERSQDRIGKVRGREISPVKGSPDRIGRGRGASPDERSQERIGSVRGRDNSPVERFQERNGSRGRETRTSPVERSQERSYGRRQKETSPVERSQERSYGRRQKETSPVERSQERSYGRRQKETSPVERSQERSYDRVRQRDTSPVERSQEGSYGRVRQTDTSPIERSQERIYGRVRERETSPVKRSPGRIGRVRGRETSPVERSQERISRVRSTVEKVEYRERRPITPNASKEKSKKSKVKETNGKKRKEKKSKKSKSKKNKRKSSSSESDSDSDSSVSSANSLILLQRLEEERKKQKMEEKKRKEDLKAMETPEEKRQRRLAKKEGKERKRKERMGWDPEHLHYTNTDNPFGDHDLLGTFVWKKKLEKEGMNNLSKDDLERINRLKQEENKRELEKVKKRRLEKEKEAAARDEEQSLLQRQKEAEQFQEWGKQEDVFHLEQARLRSKIRIKDGRAKPIDLLAQYVSAEDEVDAIEMHEPYTYLNGLTIADLEDLLEDIKVYKELELGKNLSYWNDITVIVEDELRKLRKLEQDDDYRMAIERREGINSAVASDVSDTFKGKTAEKLEELKIKIQSKLDGSVHGLDISYWESLLSQLKAHIARARLRDRHQDNLKEKLAILKAQQGVKVEAESEEEENVVDDNSPEPLPPGEPGPPGVEMDVVVKAPQEGLPSEASENEDEDEDDETKDVIDESIQKYLVNGYSPKLISSDEIEPGIFVIGEDEDNARLDMARGQVLNVGQKVENVWTAEEKALEKEAKKGMTNDEAGFSVEAPTEQVYLWSDKYRPRKPRYFNRVHTGFEWNKYNQTHYDMDNPPPKIVQGYKFNIFFPDLIDKSSTPSYTVTACKDNPDFGILRFKAGPPYEDIAFKIVNREWEYSYKRGFRCQFHNNIFQLWFHFKRYRYRR